jgi:hypothetical protein
VNGTLLESGEDAFHVQGRIVLWVESPQTMYKFSNIKIKRL